MYLCPMSSNKPVLNVTTAIVSKVTCDLPLQGATHVNDMPHIVSLNLADPTFHQPGRIDLLLGCDTIPDTIPDIMLQNYIVNTVFGWAILGKYLPQGNHQTVNVVNPTEVMTSLPVFGKFRNRPLTNPRSLLMRSLYSNTLLPPILTSNHQLPSVINDHTTLGLSRPQVLNCYLSNENQAVVKDYIELGHAKIVHLVISHLVRNIITCPCIG